MYVFAHFLSRMQSNFYGLAIGSTSDLLNLKCLYFVLYAGGHSNHRSTLEVPIFWFIHNEPLLLDKHYQAKALSNMVVVVQSDDDSWESHLQCNGRPILWDLRLDF